MTASRYASPERRKSSPTSSSSRSSWPSTMPRSRAASRAWRPRSRPRLRAPADGVKRRPARRTDRCIRCIGTTSAAHELPIGPRSTIVAIAMRHDQQRAGEMVASLSCCNFAVAQGRDPSAVAGPPVALAPEQARAYDASRLSLLVRCGRDRLGRADARSTRKRQSAMAGRWSRSPRLVLCTVDTQFAAAHRRVDECAVVPSGRVGMGVAAKEAAGHAHPRDGDRTGAL